MTCRFVTGLLDSHQVKQKKMSMYSIAKSIGLPATYVELRHQATHEELPSLSKLRTATQKALRWIWDYYWVNLTVETPPASNDDCKTFVRRVVGEADDGRRRELETNISRWNEDDLLMAVLELQWTSKDSQVLLRCLDLHGKITASVGATAKSGAKNSEASNPISKLERLRDEMASMDESLADADVEPLVQGDENDSMKVDDASSGDGWALWEGPWIPKPIGVV